MALCNARVLPHKVNGHTSSPKRLQKPSLKNVWREIDLGYRYAAPKHLNEKRNEVLGSGRVRERQRRLALHLEQHGINSRHV